MRVYNAIVDDFGRNMVIRRSNGSVLADGLTIGKDITHDRSTMSVE